LGIGPRHIGLRLACSKALERFLALMGRHLARASEANAALLGSLAALAGPGADQLALPDASAQGGPRIAQASRYHRETCPDRDDAARELARVCKAWARVPAGIANARARSVAAPIANREPQKSTGEGRKCSQLFFVEHEGATPGGPPTISNSQGWNSLESETSTLVPPAGLSLSC